MRRRLLASALPLVAALAFATPAAAHTLTPTSHDFGQVPVGKFSAIQDFTVTAQTTQFQVSSATISGTGFSGVTQPGTTPCGGFINPGQSCTVSIRLMPLSPGLKTGSLVVSGGTGTLSASLSGTGVSSAPAGGGKKKKCKMKGKKSAAAAKKCKGKKK